MPPPSSYKKALIKARPSFKYFPLIKLLFCEEDSGQESLLEKRFALQLSFQCLIRDYIPPYIETWNRISSRVTEVVYHVLYICNICACEPIKYRCLGKKGDLSKYWNRKSR